VVLGIGFTEDIRRTDDFFPVAVQKLREPEIQAFGVQVGGREGADVRGGPGQVRQLQETSDRLKFGDNILRPSLLFRPPTGGRPSS
jgi:hypothetical protein